MTEKELRIKTVGNNLKSNILLTFKILFDLIPQVGRYSAVSLMFITSCIGLILLRFNMNPYLSILGIVFIALCFGGFLGTFPGITAENWGPLYNGSNYGVMFTAYGLAAILGPRLAALIKESSNGDYGQAFVISVAMNVIGIVLITILQRKKQPQPII